MNTISKKEFRALVENNNNRCGKTISVGDVKFNQGKIYNPRVNGGMGYGFLGDETMESTVNALWRQAKKAGKVSCDGINYTIEDAQERYLVNWYILDYNVEGHFWIGNKRNAVKEVRNIARAYNSRRYKYTVCLSDTLQPII